MVSPRKLLRDSLFRFLRKVSETDDAKAMAAMTLQGLLNSRPRLGGNGLTAAGETLPYAELQTARQRTPVDAARKLVFISARFRTGSTLLWNIFRSVNGVTAYYEPLNERRWFSRQARGTRTDPSHRHVTDYWREYDGLEELGEWYRPEWISRNLYMDESFWDPALKRYIEILCERARGRPVLQFNRVDFRLPWLRKNFPRAQVVHLYRHPRDQWCSTLVDPAAFPSSHGMEEFQHHDHYYLGMWVNDLKYHFPFLQDRTLQHPYRLFYCLWRLSFSFGRRYSDFSLAYEELVKSPSKTLGALFDLLEIEVGDWGEIERVVARSEPGKWRHYAPDDWFRGHEEACHEVLCEYTSPG